MSDESISLLWDELVDDIIERSRCREDAIPSIKMPPGYYDDLNYVGANESSFGLEDYIQELSEIKRAQGEKKIK